MIGSKYKYFFLSLIGAACMLLSGCMIPYSTETASEKVIGARTDANGIVCEQIVNRDKKLNVLVFGLPEIVRTSYLSYSRYAVLTERTEKPIDAMEHFPSLAHTNVSVALPVPNSDIWITYEEKKCNMDDYDINLIIFSVSEGQILRHRFKRVRRFYQKDRVGIFWLNIEANADLSWLRVCETDKTTRINTATGEMVPETDDLPPFVPVAYDYKKWKKLCKEPRLVPGLD